MGGDRPAGGDRDPLESAAADHGRPRPARRHGARAEPAPARPPPRRGPAGARARGGALGRAAAARPAGGGARAGLEGADAPGRREHPRHPRPRRGRPPPAAAPAPPSHRPGPLVPARPLRPRLDYRAVPGSPVPREPLFFERIGVPAVWGGRRLAADLGWDPPFADPLGETWEVSDLPGRESVVRGGEFGGSSLRELMAAAGRRLLGRSRPGAGGRFPLLVKFLEAGSDLSVQVHPGGDDPAAPGKVECWTFLDGCEPGAEVLCGLAPGTSREAFAAAAGTPECPRLLDRHPARPGEFLFVPPGQPHSVRRGVRLLEIQQTSDTTYRLWDWDRTGLDGLPRQLHLEAGLAAIDFDHPLAPPFAPEYRANPAGCEAALLVHCEPFLVRALRLPTRHLLRPRSYACVLAVVRGRGAVADPDGAFPRRGLRFGDVFLLPADTGPVLLEPDPEGLELIEATAL
ncbi:MAG: hypothetical protein D6702_12880 [Planctomycetota bacterium]|nr:MAG: hypothetical protein D6702_12880 [Planctomycetota bacterium]